MQKEGALILLGEIVAAERLTKNRQNNNQTYVFCLFVY